MSEFEIDTKPGSGQGYCHPIEVMAAISRFIPITQQT